MYELDSILDFIEKNFTKKLGPSSNGNYKFEFIKGEVPIWGDSFKQALISSLEREPVTNAKK